MVGSILHKIAYGLYAVSAIGLCASLGISWNYSTTQTGVNQGDPSYFVPCIVRVIGFIIAIIAVGSSIFLKQAFETARYIALWTWIASALGVIAIAVMDPGAQESFSQKSDPTLTAIKFITIIFSLLGASSAVLTVTTVGM